MFSDAQLAVQASIAAVILGRTDQTAGAAWLQAGKIMDEHSGTILTPDKVLSMLDQAASIVDDQ